MQTQIKPMFCDKCGTKLIEGSMFCDNCGEKITEENTSEVSDSSTARSGMRTLLLALKLRSRNFYQHLRQTKDKKLFFGISILIVAILAFSFYKIISNEQEETNKIEDQLKNIQQENTQSVDTLKSELQTQENTTAQAQKQAQKNEAITESVLQKISSQNNTNVFSSGIPKINTKAIVLIICEDSANNLQEGSGTIIDPRGYVLTNEHVVTDSSGNPLTCAALMNNGSDNPQISKSIGYNLTTNDSHAGYYTSSDAAILKIYNAEYIDTDTPAPLPEVFPYIKPNGGNLHQGDSLYIFGYPAASNFVFNLTKGIVSSLDGAYINTDAIIDHGNSGGAAFTSDGRFIGIPTQKYIDNGDYLGQILDISTLNTSL